MTYHMSNKILAIQLYIILLCHVVGAFTPAQHNIQQRYDSNSQIISSQLHSTVEEETQKSSDNTAKKTKIISDTQKQKTPAVSLVKRKMEVAWCNHDSCYEAIREKVVGEHNHFELTGPATGQVVYSWEKYSMESQTTNKESKKLVVASPPAVLLLVKHHEEELINVAVEAIEELINNWGVQVLVDSTFRKDLDKVDSIDLDSDMIRLFDPQPVSGFGSGEQLNNINDNDDSSTTNGISKEQKPPADLSDADLVVTLGGDGLLMYAAHVFSGPVPPILPVAGGSMGFLTPFAREEMLEAILISLGLKVITDDDEDDVDDSDISSDSSGLTISQRALNNMQIEATDRDDYHEKPPLKFGNNNQICISMRMRLDCRIFSSDGSLKSRYAVLNEVVIDRGSSPYLASLECFCDDVHLTTVQADGIIFSTPTGSTAYSMAAGGSVVHPAVPSILVTPICPHVLSFRSMVFPDHVVLRCYVPSDARSSACVYFDGQHRTELNRGDSVQIKMSAHPVPTINRQDHSADWLSSLKSNFNFNTRVKQKPL